MNPAVLDYSTSRPRSWRRVALWLLVAAAAFLLFAAGLRLVRGRVASRQARLAAANANVAMLQVALDAFRQDTGRYPTAAEGLGALLIRPSGAQAWRGPYLRGSVAADPWGNPYAYTESNGKYRIASAGPDGKTVTADDITVAGPPAAPEP